VKTRILMISGVLALAGVSLLAIPGPVGIFNTGITSGAGCIGTVTLSAGCALAVHGSTAVQGWSITSVPSGSTTPVAITSTGGAPVTSGYWLVDNTTSRWLRPNNGTAPFAGNDTDPIGFYTWQTQFTLTAAQAATAHITGRFATDDQASMSLNGNFIASTLSGTSYTTWTPFTIDVGAGFNAGLNTLTLQVRNLSNTGARAASGIRLEFASVHIPEGGEIAVLTMALCVALFLWNRKKETVVPVV